MAVEPGSEVAGQRVVQQQAVGTVLSLQLRKLEVLPLPAVAGGKEQSGKDEKTTSHRKTVYLLPNNLQGFLHNVALLVEDAEVFAHVP